MDKAESPFLNLPIELQLEVIGLVRDRSDLKALCHVSKILYDVTKPFLYRKVNLKITGDSKANNMKRIGWEEEDRLSAKKISSLILHPANLRFVRALGTGRLGMKPTKLMDQLLPLLQKDSLLELNYSQRSTKFFPTLPQMQLLWSTQTRLRKHKFCTQMVPSIREFVKRCGPGSSPLLNSFTELDINYGDADSSNIFWPLKNLNLGLLQSLTIDAFTMPRHLWPHLQALFTDGFFFNVTRLSLQFIPDFHILTLVNMPSIESLDMYHCGSSRYPILRLVLEDNFPLKILSFSHNGNVERLVPMLAQIKGLESLVIKLDASIDATTARQGLRAFARAVVAHKETLRLFKLKVLLRSNFPSLLWEDYVVREIRLCKKIVDLSLTLTATQPIYYRHLIASFPDLSTLTIYKGIDIWSPERALEIFPASTNLESVLFKNYGYRQRFVRKELERICDNAVRT